MRAGDVNSGVGWLHITGAGILGFKRDKENYKDAGWSPHPYSCNAGGTRSRGPGEAGPVWGRGHTCWGCTASSWGSGASGSFCWVGSSCPTWRSSWKSASRTFGRVNSPCGACWASPGPSRMARAIFSWSPEGDLSLCGCQAEESGPFPRMKFPILVGINNNLDNFFLLSSYHLRPLISCYLEQVISLPWALFSHL